MIVATREQSFLPSVRAPTEEPSKEEGPRPKDRTKQSVLGKVAALLARVPVCVSLSSCLGLGLSGLCLSGVCPVRCLVFCSFRIVFSLWAPSRRLDTSFQVSPYHGLALVVGSTWVTWQLRMTPLVHSFLSTFRCCRR